MVICYYARLYMSIGGHSYLYYVIDEVMGLYMDGNHCTIVL